MNVLIADTFTRSLARLSLPEQKGAKITWADLALDKLSGLHLEPLKDPKDPNYWSVRVNDDVRIILHKTGDNYLLCYIDHHAEAYRWPLYRKLEVHPKTGAMQLVTLKEVVQEVINRVVVDVLVAAPPKVVLSALASDDELLSYGVPPELLADVRAVNEDTFMHITSFLPAEAAEALLQVFSGNKPKAPQPVGPGTDPYAHPDAQRRFRNIYNIEELKRAFDYPWDKWLVFLHPEQRQWVEREYSGPARVSGSAGTGKTIVAVQRAVHLARKNPQARILLTTISEVLANDLRHKRDQLISNEPQIAEQVEVSALPAIGMRLYRAQFGAPKLATRADARVIIEGAAQAVGGHKFSLPFLYSEWDHVVDAWQLHTWEQYRDVQRLGRKTRVAEPQRRVLWSIFEKAIAALEADALLTEAGLFTKLADALAASGQAPFDYAIVDESQDISIPHLRYLAMLGKARKDSLFFAGDLGQRIYQQPFSWRSLGVDIRGRSRTLQINYRTSHQIRAQADRLLNAAVADVDENNEVRNGTISVFDGAAPLIKELGSEAEEATAVGAWIAARLKDGASPHEIGVLVRSEAEYPRARAALQAAQAAYTVLDDSVATKSGTVSITKIELAKGLEFRCVAVMACDADIIPLQSRIESAADEPELKEVYETERHLLYVACTRARDHLLVTSSDSPSEFLSDLQANAG